MQRYGNFKILQILGQADAICECTCGRRGKVPIYKLMNGSLTHCGCGGTAKATHKPYPIRFGSYTLLSISKSQSTPHCIRYCCKCLCGRRVILSYKQLMKSLNVVCRYCDQLYKDPKELKDIKKKKNLKKAEKSKFLGKKFGFYKVLHECAPSKIKTLQKWFCSCTICGEAVKLTELQLKQSRRNYKYPCMFCTTAQKVHKPKKPKEVKSSHKIVKKPYTGYIISSHSNLISTSFDFMTKETLHSSTNQYGSWSLIDKYGEIWECMCDLCYTIKDIPAQYMISNNIPKCTCSRKDD